MLRRIRRALSFIGLSVSLVFFAKAMEIMTLQANSIMVTRACLAESFSVLANASAHDMRSFATLIEDSVDRNPELVSIGIRNSSGRYLATTTEHQETWPTHEILESNDQFMSIPLTNGQREWGNLEFRFVPIAELTPESFATMELRYVALLSSPLCFLLATIMIRFLLRVRSKRRSAEVKKQIENSAHIQRAHNEFLSRLHRELVPPLNVILGYSEILRRGMEESAQQRKEYLNRIYNSSSHILELADDVTALASIEAGEVDCEIKDCSPCNLISDVVAIADRHLSPHGIYIRCHVDGEIPDSIQTDPTRVYRILMNLVASAIRRTKEGGITIACRYNRQKPELEFQVLDTGVGIDESELSQMFDDPNENSVEMERSYFGIAICRKFAEALDGRISATSDAGNGNTFTVRLPCEPAKTAKMLTPGQAMKKTQSAGQQDTAVALGRIKESKILVVDDTDTTRHLVRLILTRIGLEFDEARNGQEAIDRIAKGDYDLVLMDMKMPVMDGYQATQKLRKNGYSKPIIALSESTRVIDRQRCMSAGCNDISPKPIDFDKLHSLLHSILGDESQFKGHGAFQDREFDISQLSRTADRRASTVS